MSGEAERTSVFILGLGLIGGSLALALTASGHYRVVGCDRDAETLRKALAAGALAGEGTEEALAQAELVILAVPPQAAAAFLREQATNLRPEAVVTDVCGVKTRWWSNVLLCAAGRGLFLWAATPWRARRSAALTRRRQGCSKGPAIL